MKRQAFNPFLPSHEYIPDGEPRVFDGRLYLFGSHDRFCARIFCVNDYVCWSAPLADLADWRYEGVLYRKRQDPLNKSGRRLLFAPDVVRGPDGRYYLYYALDFMGIMGVAVCDEPAGRYTFLGHVRFADGHIWGTRSGEPFPFDPGAFVDDDGRIFLYAGFATRIPSVLTRLKRLTHDGAVALELEADMLTIKQAPRTIVPAKAAADSPYAGHAFFEASSMRKIGRRYYFIYSSERNHELCYAVSDFPDRGFAYAGTLISLGDVGLAGIESERDARNYLGNTHGSIAQIGDDWYVFYHRHTNRHSYSRQACAERLALGADGLFAQAEVTSCGLNGGALAGTGNYPAYIACNLWSAKGTARYDMRFSRLRLAAHPYLTQDEKDGDANARQYIANIRDGAMIGYKYFHFDTPAAIAIVVRGRAKGKMIVATDARLSRRIAEVAIDIAAREDVILVGALAPVSGCYPLFFRYEGRGVISFIGFELRAA